MRSCERYLFITFTGSEKVPFTGLLPNGSAHFFQCKNTILFTDKKICTINNAGSAACGVSANEAPAKLRASAGRRLRPARLRGSRHFPQIRRKTSGPPLRIAHGLSLAQGIDVVSRCRRFAAAPRGGLHSPRLAPSCRRRRTAHIPEKEASGPLVRVSFS